MRPPLEKLIVDYFFKQVKITLNTAAEFEGFFVGIKLPANQTVMLQLVANKNVAKYTKHLNPTWILLMPYEMIEEISFIENASGEIEDALVVAVLKDKEKRLTK